MQLEMLCTMVEKLCHAVQLCVLRRGMSNAILADQRSVGSSHLAEIAAQEEAPGRVLHSFAKLNQVLEDVFGCCLFAADVAAADSAQQIPAYV